jgi:hypothetical protein
MHVAIDCDNIFRVRIQRGKESFTIALDESVIQYKCVIGELVSERLLSFLTLDDEEIIDQEITEMFIPYAEYDQALNDPVVTERLYDTVLTLFTMVRHTLLRIAVNDERNFDPTKDVVKKGFWLGYTFIVEIDVNENVTN